MLILSSYLFQQMDQDILLWIQQNLRHQILTPFFRVFTSWGNHAELWIGLLLFILLLSGVGVINRKYRWAGLMGFLSLLTSFLIINLWLKNVIARTRPYLIVGGLERLIEIQSDFSFPSGHSASSFAVAVVLFYYLPLKYGVLVLALAGLMAYSRLYLGVHYLSDVVAGIMIGTAIALLIIRLGKTWAKKRNRRIKD